MPAVKYDVDRYQSLISRTAFNCEFFRGTIQDQSKNRLAMTRVGTPAFIRAGSVQALSQRTSGDRITSAAIPRPISCVIPFFVEFFGSCRESESVIAYIAVAGGWYMGFNSTSECMVLLTRTAAGALARYSNTPIGGMKNGISYHVLMWLDPIGLSAKSWVNGVPVTTTFTNVGVPADDDGITLRVLGVALNRTQSITLRIWQGTPDNEDASCLYAASQSLVSG